MYRTPHTVRLYSYMKSELAGLRRRLEKGEAALVALTPPRQRGKKQIQTEGELLSAIENARTENFQNGGLHDCPEFSGQLWAVIDCCILDSS